MIAAGIVLFHPAPMLLEEALAALEASVAQVYLFLNAPLDAAARAVLDRPGRRAPVLLGDGSNQGLGIAYNRMAAVARAEGFEALLLLDQDSSPPPAMAAALLGVRARLIAVGECPAVVGPMPVAAQGCGCKAPRRCRRGAAAPVAGAVPLEFVISSGSLIDLAAFEALGGFREDFFIDAVDIEWCLRAWAGHFSCWMLATMPMPHRLGSGVLRVPLLGLRLALQPPRRLYTHARNQVAMLRLATVPLAWKCRAVVTIAAQSVLHAAAGRSWQALRAFAWGITDGMRDRLGPVARDFGRDARA